MNVVKIEEIENRIVNLCGEKVLMDAAVADVYGISTKEVNQAVFNNPEKFPQGYLFELTDDEKQEVVKNFDHLAKLKFSPFLPKAFTKVRHLSQTLNQLTETDDEARQKTLLQKSGEIIAEVLGDECTTTDTETTVELNVAFLKVKHTIKKKKS